MKCRDRKTDIIAVVNYSTPFKNGSIRIEERKNSIRIYNTNNKSFVAANILNSLTDFRIIIKAKKNKQVYLKVS